MKERPILFSAPMVRAIINGTKTQTRRVVKPQPLMVTDRTTAPWNGPPGALKLGLEQLGRGCPYGQPGDRLWVRETFARIDGQTRPWIETDYRATYTHGDRLGDTLGIKKRWTPSIHMPRAASRITLEVTGVRVECLQDISEADAIAEGVFKKVGTTPIGNAVETATGGELIYAVPTQAREEYHRLWESINSPGSWDANPWVWVIEFKRLEGGAA